MAKIDGPMTCGYGIDASDATQKSTMRSRRCHKNSIMASSASSTFEAGVFRSDIEGRHFGGDEIRLGVCWHLKYGISDSDLGGHAV
jgi:hypothetical protein